MLILIEERLGMNTFMGVSRHIFGFYSRFIAETCRDRSERAFHSICRRLKKYRLNARPEQCLFAHECNVFFEELLFIAI